MLPKEYHRVAALITVLITSPLLPRTLSPIHPFTNLIAFEFRLRLLVHLHLNVVEVIFWNQCFPQLSIGKALITQSSVLPHCARCSHPIMKKAASIKRQWKHGTDDTFKIHLNDVFEFTLEKNSTIVFSRTVKTLPSTEGENLSHQQERVCALSLPVVRTCPWSIQRVSVSNNTMEWAGVRGGHGADPAAKVRLGLAVFTVCPVRFLLQITYDWEWM